MLGRSSPRTRTLVGFGLSFVAVAGCAWWASRQPAPTLPTGADDLAVTVAAIFVFGAAIGGRGWRWDTILANMRIRHRRSDAYALTLVGQMGNIVLPARGGELLKIFLLAKRSAARSSEVLGSIITERLLDVGALTVLFTLFAALQVGDLPGGRNVGALAAAGLLVLVAAACIYLRLRVAGRFAAFAQRVRPIARASRQLLTPAGLGLGLASCVVWCVDGGVLWLCARALDVALSPLDAIAVVVLAGFSAIVPSGPGDDRHL